MSINLDGDEQEQTLPVISIDINTSNIESTCSILDEPVYEIPTDEESITAITTDVIGTPDARAAN